jgi:hypothetical protein
VSPVPTSPSGSSVIPSSDYLLANKIMVVQYFEEGSCVFEATEQNTIS